MFCQTYVINQLLLLVISLFNWASEQFISDFATIDNSQEKFWNEAIKWAQYGVKFTIDWLQIRATINRLFISLCLASCIT